MCAFCGKIDKNYLCKDCESRIKEMAEVHVEKYNKNNFYYNEHIYFLKYEGYIREKILSYKFNDKAYYYKTFVNILLNNKKMCEILESYDIIIPVPIHNKRRKERGYNQTSLIAKDMTQNFKGLEYIDILNKKYNTRPQSTLSKKERIKNAKNMYELKNINNIERLYRKNILIFDDIYTTGSTANECAKSVHSLHPKKIGILTIAKD